MYSLYVYWITVVVLEVCDSFHVFTIVSLFFFFPPSFFSKHPFYVWSLSGADIFHIRIWDSTILRSRSIDLVQICHSTYAYDIALSSVAGPSTLSRSVIQYRRQLSLYNCAPFGAFWHATGSKIRTSRHVMLYCGFGQYFCHWEDQSPKAWHQSEVKCRGYTTIAASCIKV